MKVLSTEGLTKLIDLIKSSFISNEDTQATVAVDAVETTAVDAVETNVADESSLTVGSVINQRDNTTAIKTWTGTLAQYNAIATKDSNTLYNITDDNTAVVYQAYTKSEVDSLIEAIYPVGSIYIGTQSTCPLETLISGSTWTKVSEGRVLQGSDSGHLSGSTIAAGLPNITGTAQTAPGRGGYTMTGAFGNYTTVNATSVYQTGTPSTSAQSQYGINIDASRSSSIYGNSNTVQPPAYVVNIWERTA